MKTSVQSDKSEAIKNGVAGKLAKTILRIQLAFAERMKKLTGHWTKRQQWLFLYLFCFAFGALSLASLISPAKMKTMSGGLNSKPISRPEISAQKPAVIITDEEFRQVEEYIHQHPGLQESQPGLFDSLALVEEMYYSQKK